MPDFKTGYKLGIEKGKKIERRFSMFCLGLVLIGWCVFLVVVSLF